jgi:hypothetical protein
MLEPSGLSLRVPNDSPRILETRIERLTTLGLRRLWTAFSLFVRPLKNQEKEKILLAVPLVRDSEVTFIGT